MPSRRVEKLGVWQKVEPKLEQVDNVRAALNLVSRGEVFGIVYATDAKAQPKVKVVDTFPESTHSQIIYPVAIVERQKIPTPQPSWLFCRRKRRLKF